MADGWTPSLVEERLAEAAEVLRRLPEQRVQGLFSTWPAVIRDFADRIAQEPERLRRPPPSAAAITRMDEVLQWLAWLDPADAKLVWMRASGAPWKEVCWRIGLARTAAHEHWLFALCVIAWRLAGQQLPRNRSRRQVIEATIPARPEKRSEQCSPNTFRADKSGRSRA